MSSSSYADLSSTTPTSGTKRSIFTNDVKFSKFRASSCLRMSESKDLHTTKEIIEECSDKDQLFKMYEYLKRKDLKLEEKLHKLQVIKQRHSKITPVDLVSLTKKWLTAAQSALVKLHEVFPEPKPNNVLDLMDKLRIDPEVVKYDPEHHIFPSE